MCRGVIFNHGICGINIQSSSEGSVTLYGVFYRKSHGFLWYLGPSPYGDEFVGDVWKSLFHHCIVVFIFFFFCRIECLVLCSHLNLQVSYHVWQNHWVKDISWADPLKVKDYVAHLSSVCSDISQLIALYQSYETH